MASKLSIIFLLSLLASASKAHYTPELEKPFIEVVEFCSYQNELIELYAKYKFKGAPLDTLLSIEEIDINKNLIRSLYQANPTSNKELMTYKQESKRQCIANAANDIHRIYKLPTSHFDQEEADLVKNMIAECSIARVLGEVVFTWEKQGLTKDEALKKASGPNIIPPKMINFMYDQRFTNESSAKNFLELMEKDCRNTYLKKMVSGETVFPWTD